MPKLTEAERDRLAIAIHEAGHAVMGTLLGGRLHTAVVAEGATFGLTGETVFDELADHFTASTAYAGPLAEARFRFGPTPRVDQVWAVLDGCGSRDQTAIVAAVGVSRPPNSAMIAKQLTTCWSSIATVANRLYFEGEVRHADVCAALGVTDGGGPGSFQLANIKAGLQRPVPRRVRA